MRARRVAQAVALIDGHPMPWKIRKFSSYGTLHPPDVRGSQQSEPLALANAPRPLPSSATPSSRKLRLHRASRSAPCKAVATPEVLRLRERPATRGPIDQQSYTPAAQRREVRLAEPATLTGVSGRPTTASAVEIKLGTLGLNTCPPSPRAQSPRTAVSSTAPKCFDIVILHLQSRNAKASHSACFEDLSDQFSSRSWRS